MKFTRTLSLAAASLLLAGAASAQPYGMGPGMMGGYGGGYGMGQGMMGGYGGGMGAGGMWGDSNGAFASLKLTPEQRKKIADIQAVSSKAAWQLMGAMHEQGTHMQGMYGAGPVDEAAARESYRAMSEAQKAMFELHLDTRKKIDAVLTKEQRDELAHFGNPH